jgi:hypothetical protein
MFVYHFDVVIYVWRSTLPEPTALRTVSFWHDNISSHCCSVMLWSIGWHAVCLTLEDGTNRLSQKTSVTNYQPMLCKIPEERRPQLYHAESLKSYIVIFYQNYPCDSELLSGLRIVWFYFYIIWNSIQGTQHFINWMCFVPQMNRWGGTYSAGSERNSCSQPLSIWCGFCYVLRHLWSGRMFHIGYASFAVTWMVYELSFISPWKWNQKYSPFSGCSHHQNGVSTDHQSLQKTCL